MNSSGLLWLIAVVFLAVTSLTVGDAAGKLLAAGGMNSFVVAWSRFGLAAFILLPFSGLSLRELPVLLDWRVFFRAVFVTSGVICILTALKTVPMADAFGAFFIGPVVSYALAIVFLGERPSRLRGGLLAISFIGVMLVVKPGFGTSSGILFALAAGAFHGAFLTMTRTVSGEFRPRLLLISQLLVGTIVLTPIGLNSDLLAVDLRLSMLLIISALGSALGNFLLVIASKKAEASLVAPLIYIQLVPVTILGALVFGDIPDLFSFAGLTLIILSGAGSLIASQVSLSQRFGR